MKRTKMRRKHRPKRFSEKEVDIAKMAGIAFEKAFRNAKKRGLTIVKREGDKVVKLYPNGKKEILSMTKSVRVKRRTFTL